MRRSDSSTSVSGLATWIAASGPYANVKTRRCVPSTCDVRPERRAAFARDREHVVVDGEPMLLARRARTDPSLRTSCT